MEHSMLIARAQALRALSSATFIALDTTGLEKDADIIQITLADSYGHRWFDQLIRPTRQVGQANTVYTGITPEQLADMPTFAEAWPRIWVRLQDRYLLAYGLNFIISRLNENVGAYRLVTRDLAPAPPLPLVGSDLMEMAQAYYGETRAIKQAQIARYLGVSLGTPPLAKDRVALLAKLLAQMSGSLAQVEPDEPDDDESPF